MPRKCNRSEYANYAAVKNHLVSPQGIEALGEKLCDLRMAVVSLCYAELLNTTEVRKCAKLR